MFCGSVVYWQEGEIDYTTVSENSKILEMDMQFSLNDLQNWGKKINGASDMAFTPG
jgi:hypothetical protein